jgi:phenylalanyl-tRNA synthetase beta chain
MKAPISWLKQYVDIDLPPEELAHKLTMAGVEAGAIETTGGWDNIVVGEIVGIDPHPQADRLKLVTIDTAGVRTTVVCGAPNVSVGQRVPFARVGAELINPDSGKPEKLKKVKIRGVTSEGMVCSECELGISDSHVGIMVLPADAPKGAPLDDYLGDIIFDMNITPNRPDLLSIAGIAREIAALTGKTIRIPDASYSESEDAADKKASVEILAPDLCPRYCASIITDLEIKPSPPWMQQRLLACGMRPINNVVDVTNYVMLEYGQPLHAFDYENIADRKIIVRRANNESMNTLDGVARQLSNYMLVIADGMGPVAVAGVMGGAKSEVTDTTTSVLLESANFNPVSIRRTSTQFKLRSEASIRFEKGLSPELPLPALKRATQLIAELSGGKIARGIIDTYPGKSESVTIRLTVSKVKRVLGVEIAADRINAILESLEFRCRRAGADELDVIVPYWRTDIRIPEDLVEEVARIIGYDEIPTTIPSGALPAYKPDPVRTLREKVSDILASCGMQEVITYSLTSRETLNKVSSNIVPLKVANPITMEQEYLRTTLRPGLLQTLSNNEKHEEDGIKLFEIGKIYLPKKNDLPEERYMLSSVLAGPRQECYWQGGNEKLDFFDAKGIVETLLSRLEIEASFEPASDNLLTPGRTVAIKTADDTLGVLGELHPRIAERFDIGSLPVYLFEMDLQKLITLTGRPYEYRPIPKFPSTLRDIALVVDIDTTSRRIREIIEESQLVARAVPFDVYTGEQIQRGKKSLAFRITYQSPERTLTDEEVDHAQQQIIERLAKELGATLR